ncbi:hypothetical protein [Turneriella parva]|uniref:hypothetical protein n=1 Tax=Turneriella parva TaxID=29510 RepID=UPI0006A741AD|nr:hypothetical protein [Turneriella parva]
MQIEFLFYITDDAPIHSAEKKWPKGLARHRSDGPAFRSKKEITSFSSQVPLQALLVLQLVLQLLLLALQLSLLALFLQLKSKPGKRSLQRAEQLL